MSIATPPFPATPVGSTAEYHGDASLVHMIALGQTLCRFFLHRRALELVLLYAEEINVRSNLSHVVSKTSSSKHFIDAFDIQGGDIELHYHWGGGRGWLVALVMLLNCKELQMLNKPT